MPRSGLVSSHALAIYDCFLAVARVRICRYDHECIGACSLASLCVPLVGLGGAFGYGACCSGERGRSVVVWGRW